MARTNANRSAQPAWVSLGKSGDMQSANEPMIIRSNAQAYPEDAATVLAPIAIGPAESQEVMLELGLPEHTLGDVSSAPPRVALDAPAVTEHTIGVVRVLIVTLAAFACAACLAATAWVLLAY